MSSPRVSSSILETLQDQDIIDAFDSFIHGLDPVAQYVETDNSPSSEASSSAAAAAQASLGSSPTTSTRSAPDIHSLKASTCPHGLRYDNALPWSGPYFDFDIRCCDECRAQREQLGSHPIPRDPAAGLETLKPGCRDEEALVSDFVVDEEEAQGQGGNGLVASSGADYLPVFCPLEEGLTESPPAMSADEGIVDEEFDGRQVRFRADVRGFCGSNSSDGCSEYRYLSSDSEACSALLIGEEGRGSLSDHEGDDDADEMMSDIGVSFSRRHFWVGEEFDL